MQTRLCWIYVCTPCKKRANSLLHTVVEASSLLACACICELCRSCHSAICAHIHHTHQHTASLSLCLSLCSRYIGRKRCSIWTCVSFYFIFCVCVWIEWSMADSNHFYENPIRAKRLAHILHDDTRIAHSLTRSQFGDNSKAERTLTHIYSLFPTRRAHTHAYNTLAKLNISVAAIRYITNNQLHLNHQAIRTCLLIL